MDPLSNPLRSNALEPAVTANVLAKMFEQNHWANLQLVPFCMALDDEQLDATPLASTEWSIRRTLVHTVDCQRGYLALLTLPVGERPQESPAFDELLDAVTTSGEGLQALTSAEAFAALPPHIRSSDGYVIEPWVVMVQAIHHATEHRRQICAMLRALGVTPPERCAWKFAESVGACVQEPA
jgi:uncharacterized damage-inducible protein DinB